MKNEEKIELYINELKVLKASLDDEDRFLTYIAKQLVTSDEQRENLEAALTELDESKLESENLREAFLDHANRITITAKEYLRK